jgi:hypothetical protein
MVCMTLRAWWLLLKGLGMVARGFFMFRLIVFKLL